MDILIIDDRFEEKIGSFTDDLDKNGLKYIVAETLDKANELFNKYFDTISTIILDFTFPRNNQSRESADFEQKPSGIIFLLDNEWRMSLAGIHLILNTCWEEKTRDRYFFESMYYNANSNLVINVRNEGSTLANLNEISKEKIIKALKEAKELCFRIRNAPRENNTRSSPSFIERYWTHNGD